MMRTPNLPKVHRESGLELDREWWSFELFWVCQVSSSYLQIKRADGGTQRTDGAKGTAVFDEQHSRWTCAARYCWTAKQDCGSFQSIFKGMKGKKDGCVLLHAVYRYILDRIVIVGLAINISTSFNVQPCLLFKSVGQWSCCLHASPVASWRVLTFIGDLHRKSAQCKEESQTGQCDIIIHNLLTTW